MSTTSRGVSLIALALLAFALAPAARAETLVFRNETGGQIVLQAASVVNGIARRDRPCLLNHRDVARVCLPGDKLIAIYDARMPNRVLHQTTISAGNEDLMFAIRFDPVHGQASLEPIPGR
jgi:hypothetical protein